MNFEHVIGGRKYIKPRKWVKVNSACISSTWKGLLHILYWIKVYILGYIIWYVAYKLYDMAYMQIYIFQIKGCAFQLLNWIARLDSNLSRLMKNSFQVWGSTISLLGIVPSTKKVLGPNSLGPISMNLIYRLINLELIKTNKVCLFRNSLITDREKIKIQMGKNFFGKKIEKYRGCKLYRIVMRLNKVMMKSFHWKKSRKYQKKIFVKNSKLFYQIMHQVIHRKALLVI